MEVFHLVHDVQKLIHSGHLHHTLLYVFKYIPLKIKSQIIVIQFITMNWKPIWFIISFNVFTLLYIFKSLIPHLKYSSKIPETTVIFTYLIHVLITSSQVTIYFEEIHFKILHAAVVYSRLSHLIVLARLNF